MQSDIRTDILDEAEYEKKCFMFPEYALWMPEEQFLFHHYDEPPEPLLICYRPMAGIEKYQVSDGHGGFYGTYDTRDVRKYILTKTWIVVENKDFFVRKEIEFLKRRIRELESSCSCS